MNKFLVVVVGPTASGKTALSIRLAKELNTEIVSADSRQFFKETTIGTAKPSDEQLQTVKHHFINSHSIHEEYNVGLYEQGALNVINKLFHKYNSVILTGGSGLYIDAVCKGFDPVPTRDTEIRKQLTELYSKEGIESLQARLRILDSEYYREIDLSNPQRLIRALEVCLITGKPYSSLRKGKHKSRGFTSIKIGLDIERRILYERINKRVDDMIASGLLLEVQSLIKYQDLNALQTVGYKELFDHYKGNLPLGKAVELIKQNTRNYAKRQLTWFRRDKDIKWFHQSQINEIMQFIEETIEPKVKGRGTKD